MPRTPRHGVAPRARKAQPGRSRFTVEPSVTSNPAVLARFSAAWLRRRVRASEAMFILLAVGIGAASALLGAVQGAPLAGAFYAFESIIGAYTPSAIAPVAGAALAGALGAQTLGVQPYVIEAVAGAPGETHHYIVYALLGTLCAGYGIVLMRAVALFERGVRRLKLPDWARPAIGGALLIPIALVSPQALSAGHGALHADLALGASLGFIATVLLAT